MTHLEAILEAIAGLRVEVAELKALVMEGREEYLTGPLSIPFPEPAKADLVPLIVDALSIVHAEELAHAKEVLTATRRRRMVGLDDDYSGPPPVAHGI